MDTLAKLPAREWVDQAEFVESGIESVRLADLAFRGVVLCDGDDPRLVRYRQRADLLESQQWHPAAALFHFMARGPEERPEEEERLDYEALEILSKDNARRFVLEHGPPPEPFYTATPKAGLSLPQNERTGDFYDVLRRRRTSRAFDIRKPLPLDDLSALLREVFGWQGQTRIAAEVLLLHRTSPSGGARHPVEARLLVQNVDGLQSGVYHYRSHQHALDLIRALPPQEVSAIALAATEGQSWVRDMHVIIVLTSRFFRNQWKYRKVMRTYASILMDAAHLSQTFYLVATDLGMGAFFSLALNTPLLERALEIDGYEEGALAICGCGVKVEGRGELAFEPFVPQSGDVS